ncbi:hypothetical protein Bca4012_009975 [Brassica carinata]
MESSVVGDPNGEAYQRQLILMSERVFLLRGSSETIVSAEEFGFLKEPYSVYTTHGGLFQSSSRVHEDSTLLLGSLEELDKVDKSQVRENDDGNITLNPVLWPCPWMADGLSESNYKGLLWGADCTESFLKQSNLKDHMNALMQDQIEKTWETCYADTQ